MCHGLEIVPEGNNSGETTNKSDHQDEELYGSSQQKQTKTTKMTPMTPQKDHELDSSDSMTDDQTTTTG